MEKKPVLFIIGMALPFLLPPYLAFLLIFALFKFVQRDQVFLVVLGLCYVLSYQAFRLPSILPVHWENREVQAIGRVDTRPVVSRDATGFVFAIENLDKQAFKTRVALKDFNLDNHYVQGNQYQLKVKLKNIRNFQNEGSRKYRQLMLAKRRVATGVVSQARIIKHSPSLLGLWREKIVNQIKLISDNTRTVALTQSLVVGVRDGMRFADWQIFRATGTSHLMAISGLHVGLIAGLFYLLVNSLWRTSACLCLRIASKRVAACVSLAAAFVYSLLSGFSTPTQRAFIMVAVFMAGIIVNQKTNKKHCFLLALLLVLLLNPYSFYMPGFYLSFFVVWVIVYFFNVEEEKNQDKDLGFSGWFSSALARLKQTLRLQWTITLLLAPLTLYLFDYATFMSLPANLIAIPLMSTLLLPFSLVVSCLSFIWLSGAKLIAIGLTSLFNGLFDYLAWLATFELFHMRIPIVSAWQLVALTGCLWCLIKARAMTYQSMALMALSFIFWLPIKARPLMGEALFSVLDVGQGLAVVVRTRNHTLLYDTGIQYRSGFNMGDAVISPYLKFQGVNQIDKLVVSHNDIDHLGGLKSIQVLLSVSEVIKNLGIPSNNCQFISPWQWDGVSFEFMTLTTAMKSDNNNSCVLKISNKHQALLLTGDIEREAEISLVRQYGNTLKAQAMLVPHHGSRSSSSQLFLKNVSPKFAFISSGRFNRWGFPASDVLERYQRLAIETFDTSSCGRINWRMNANDTVSLPRCYSITRSSQA